jgi:peptidoglycan-N-acetylmuramic acid deacetylase
MQNLHNGAVILLHAVSKDNADALDRIIKGAREKGYRIGRLEEID